MRVDIIMPVYNPNSWLKSAIESVLEQTYRDWILWIIDDNSRNKKEIIKVFEEFEADGRVKLITLERNVKQALARNIAAERGSGDLIAFIDQDDRWHPEKLNNQVRCFEDVNIGVVHADIEKIDVNGELIQGLSTAENEKRVRYSSDKTDKESLLCLLCRKNGLRLVSTMIKRDAWKRVGGYSVDSQGMEESDLWIRLAGTGTHFKHLPKVLAYRRIHDSNCSSMRMLDTVCRRFKIIEKHWISTPYCRKSLSARKWEVLKSVRPTLAGCERFVSYATCYLCTKGRSVLGILFAGGLFIPCALVSWVRSLIFKGPKKKVPYEF